MNNLIKKLIEGTEVEKKEYEALVVSYIRERYSINDELSIIRQRDSKPDEFAEYNNYVEECKVRAKENTGI